MIQILIKITQVFNNAMSLGPTYVLSRAALRTRSYQHLLKGCGIQHLIYIYIYI